MGYPRICWQNRITDATITVDSGASATGYPVDNVKDWRDYETWRGDGASNSYVLKADYGSSVSCDSFAMVGHNLNTHGARYKLEGSTNDADWDTLVSYTTPGDNFCLAKFWTSANYRYWKLTIDNNGGANFAPEVGIWFTGNYLEFDELITFPFDPDEQRDVLDSVEGGDGRLLGRALKFTKRNVQVVFEYLPPSFFTDDYLPFYNSHRLKPFVWVWDYENYADEAYLMQFPQPSFNAPYDPPKRSPLILDLEGVLEE